MCDDIKPDIPTISCFRPLPKYKHVRAYKCISDV